MDNFDATQPAAVPGLRMWAWMVGAVLLLLLGVILRIRLDPDCVRLHARS
jgi:hypothetical protein